MLDSAQTAWMCLSAVDRMAVCACLTSGVWSTALSFMSPPARMTEASSLGRSRCSVLTLVVDSNSGRISPTLAQQTMSNPPPLLRLATSPHDAHLLATFAQDSQIVRILDVRQPGQALLELRGHGGSVNCVDWSPHRRGTLATGGDDCQVLIWDIMSTNGPFNLGGANGASNPDAYRSPVAGWQCDFEVGNIGWVPRLPGEYGEWLGVSAGRGVWGIRI